MRQWKKSGSERLPVKDGKYFATTQPTYAHEKRIQMVYWRGGRWIGYVSMEVITWKELSEPWDGGEPG